MKFIDDSYLSVDFADVFCAFMLRNIDIDIIVYDKFTSVLEL
jgi:hypothetical protein